MTDAPAYLPDAGDLIWTDFNPPMGREQAGRRPALVVSSVAFTENTGFAVEGMVFHPGDSFTVPEDKIPTLLVPVTAPWLKFSEVADYIEAVGPARGYAIHDGIMSDPGLALVGNLLKLASAPDAPVTRLEPGTTVDL